MGFGAAAGKISGGLKGKSPANEGDSEEAKLTKGAQNALGFTLLKEQKEGLFNICHKQYNSRQEFFDAMSSEMSLRSPAHRQLLHDYLVENSYISFKEWEPEAEFTLGTRVFKGEPAEVLKKVQTDSIAKSRPLMKSDFGKRGLSTLESVFPLATRKYVWRELLSRGLVTDETDILVKTMFYDSDRN